MVIQAGNLPNLVIDNDVVAGVATGAVDHPEGGPLALAESVKEALDTDGAPVAITRGEYEAIEILLGQLANAEGYHSAAQLLAGRLHGR
ncbi:hypothetical protein [Kitasatospora sp. McL0602]|uniref:hypothetical protein n=1 Tax=Kitasatospora sp. McL0602 TaxID=3439530 RepID=UPI003F8C6099